MVHLVDNFSLDHTRFGEAALSHQELRVAEATACLLGLLKYAETLDVDVDVDVVT